MALTVDQDILYPACRLARVTAGPGRTPSPDQVADAFQSLNRMIDSWNIVQGLIYSKQMNEYTLATPKPVYTIGRAAGADFVADRPTRVDSMNAVIHTGGMATHIPMRLMDAEQWSQVRVREFPITFPTAAYIDYNQPNASIYFWGTPTGSPGLEIWEWQQVAQFASETDQVIIPPGYLDAAVYNLAVRLGDQFGTTGAMSPNVFSEARRTMGIVKAFNNPSPEIASWDAGTRGGGKSDFNWATGGPA